MEKLKDEDRATGGHKGETADFLCGGVEDLKAQPLESTSTEGELISGLDTFNSGSQKQEELVPYNPFLSVGANPFNPFGSSDSEAAPPDWATLLERATVELCLIGKSAILDLEQMRQLDSRFFFFFVLFCFVLFCFVLFCFVLFCFVLFCFVLFVEGDSCLALSFFFR